MRKIYLILLLLFIPTVSFAKNSHLNDTGTLFEGFNVLSDWTVAGTDGTISNDTVNYIEGNQSLKITSNNGNAVTASKTINENLSSTFSRCSLWLYVNNISNFYSTEIWLSSTTDYSKYFKYTFDDAVKKTGINVVCVNKDSFVNVNSEDWDNPMVRLRIKVIPLTTNSVSVSVDNLRRDYNATPVFVFTFDDGFQTDYTKAFPIMSVNKQKGVSFVNAITVGTGGKLNLTELNILKNNGWDISNHCNNHTSLATMDYANQLSDINTGYQWLIDNSFIKSAEIIGYPAGSFDNNTIAIAPQNHVIGRTSKGKFQFHINLGDYENRDEFVLNSETALNTTTVATVKKSINDTIQAQSLYIWYMHKIVDSNPTQYEWNLSDFQEISDFVKSKEDSGELVVETLSEYVEKSLNNITFSGINFN